MMENYLSRNINSSSKPLSESKYNTLNLQLEILDSCPHSCSGCFVKRKNKFSSEEVSLISKFLETAEFSEMNEIVLAPTDIFSAQNFDEIFDNQALRDNIISRFRALAFNSTLKANPEVIIERILKIESLFPGKALEFFVLVELELFVKRDKDYLEWLEARIKLLGRSNIVFTVNAPLKFEHPFEAPAEVANELFNRNFKYTPSFLRSSNAKIIDEHLREWNKVSYTNKRVINYVYDSHFGSHTYTTLVFHEGEMYWAPCLIDFSYIPGLNFKINSLKDINASKYQAPLGVCQNCDCAIECSSKGILALKNHLAFRECILPDDYKK